MSVQNQLTAEQAKEICDQDFWFIRPCTIYKNEYKICTSIKGRFHQYFVNGALEDCSEWKKNHSDCVRWKSDQNYIAGVRVIESEKIRKLKRLQSRKHNDIMDDRTTPPSSWNSPLPDHLEKKAQSSLLSNANIKNQNDALCTIL